MCVYLWPVVVAFPGHIHFLFQSECLRFSEKDSLNACSSVLRMNTSTPCISFVTFPYPT